MKASIKKEKKKRKRKGRKKFGKLRPGPEGLVWGSVFRVGEPRGCIDRNATSTHTEPSQLQSMIRLSPLTFKKFRRGAAGSLAGQPGIKIKKKKLIWFCSSESHLKALN